MLVLGLLMLSGIGAQLLAPQVIRYFIDTAQEQGDLNVLYATAALYLVVGLASEALSGLAIYVGRDVAWRATNRLRSVLALHVFRLDMSFHNARTPGELVERIDGDVERLANFFSQFVYNLVGGLILGSGVLVAIP